MKYEYVTVTGTNEVEVDEQFYDILLALDREEYNAGAHQFSSLAVLCAALMSPAAPFY